MRQKSEKHDISPQPFPNFAATAALFPEAPLTWAKREQCAVMGVSPDTASWNRAWIRHQLQRLDLSGSIVLDLGSGAASPFSFWYTSRARHSFLIDLHHPPQKFQKSTSLVHDLEQRLPLPNASVDLVISACTFQFLSPAARRLQMVEIARVLRSGGMAFLTMAWLFPLTEEALAALKLEPVLHERHIHFHAAPDLADMLRACPLLEIDGPADPSKFPGHPNFSPTQALADPALLVTQFTQNDPARFRPETTELKLQRLGLGVRLKKTVNIGASASAVIRPHARSLTQSVPVEPDEEAPLLLVHVHLPKNAGSSFNDLLATSFGDRFLPKYSDDPNAQLDEVHLAELIHANPGVMAIASHSIVAYPLRLGARRPLYVTFLRDPLSRHRSYYRFAKKNYSSFAPEHKKLLPPDFLDMAFADFTSFVADLAEERLMRTQCQLICGYDEAQAAIDVLSRFFFVGVVERMDRSIELLRTKLRSVGLNLDERSMPRVNQTAEHAENAPADASEMRLLKHLQSDLQLHAWVCKNLAKA